MVDKNITHTTKVETPNGTGFVQGRMFDGGVEYLIVRHSTKDLKDTSCGYSLTPLDFPTVLWAYEKDQVKVA